MTCTSSLYALSLCALLCHCAPQVGLGRADTLAPGVSRAALGLDVTLLSPKVTNGDPIQLPYLLFFGSYHRGVAPRLELGGRLYGAGFAELSGWGAAVDLKWQYVNRRIWDAALVLSIGYHEVRLGGAPYWCPNGALTALFGWNFGPHQIVLGPRFAVSAWDSDGQNTVALYGVGAAFGVHFRAGRFDVPLELALTWSPVEFNGEVASEDRFGAGVVSLGLSGAYRF
jgi:hypothetical protein